MNDRQSALDEFAAENSVQNVVMQPAIQTFAPPPALVHGKQVVLVPRDTAKVLRDINALAKAAGPDWYYRIPFKDRKTGKTTYVEGPSIKLANDVARLYGSCEVNPWVSGEGLDYWEFTARFIDLESGYAMTRVFRQRKDAAKIGGESAGRNMEASFSIGISKAIRNVVVNALQTYTDYAFEEARNSLVEKIGNDIEGWRKKTVARFADLKIDIRRVEAVIGRPAKDWLAPDIAMVVGMGKAISDGMATVDETFPPIERQEHGSTKDQLDKASGGGEEPPPEEGVTEAKDEPPVDSRAPDGSDEQQPPVTPADTKKDRKEATEKLLALASDEKLDKQARLEALEDAAGAWEEKLDAEYLGALVKAAVSIVKGFSTVADAKKTLGTFK